MYNPFKQDTPTMTYPTITRMGIREMTRQQQRNLEWRIMSPDEKISVLNERISVLEEQVKQLLARG